MMKTLKPTKRYSKAQIAKALTFWNKKLVESLNEEDKPDADGVEDDVKTGDDDETDGEEGKSRNKGEGPKVEAPKEKDEDQLKAEAKAKPLPVSFGMATRMHRLHNGAAKKVRNELQTFLQKYKASENGSVQIFNSCDNDGSFKIPEPGDIMYVTINISIDKAHVKGFSKMVALMKENDEDFLNEGFFKDLWNGVKSTAGAMKQTADKKIVDANAVLKKNIAFKAIHMYLMSFCGKAVADSLTMKNIMVGGDPEGTEDGRLIFVAAVKIS